MYIILYFFAGGACGKSSGFSAICVHRGGGGGMPNTGTGGRKSNSSSDGCGGVTGEGRSYSLSVGKVGRPDGAAGMSGAGAAGLSVVVFQRCRGGGSPKTGGGISGVGGAFVMYMLGC